MGKKKKPGQIFRAPEPLRASHQYADFDCAESALNDWLRRHALRNELAGGSRTYVVCTDSASQVVGYYSLAVGAVGRHVASGRVRRNMPDPIPVMILGRLAVDQRFHRRGLGQGMLRDAILRTAQAAEIAGIRAILVHAISENARVFYERSGFYQSPVDPMTLMLPLEDIRRQIAGRGGQISS